MKPSIEEGWPSPKTSILNVSVVVFLGVLGCATLHLAIGDALHPDGPLWSLSLLWASSQVVSYLASKCHAPPLLAITLTGLLFRNANALGEQGVPLELSSKVAWACLAVALLRAGLVMKHQVLAKHWLLVIRLGVLPCLKEITTLATIMGVLFRLPALLAIAGAPILAAACPVALATRLAHFQSINAQHGHLEGIPEALAASHVADIAVCVLLMSTFAAFAFPNSSIAVRGLHLPISLAAGVCLGLLAGVLCSWRLIWRSAYEHAAVMLLLGQALAFLGYRFHFFGASCLALLVMAFTTGSLWATGSRRPRLLTLPEPAGPDVAGEVGRKLEAVWVLVAEPLLFSLAGSALCFRDTPQSTVLKALLVVAVGILVKVPVTFFGLTFTRLGWRERLLLAFSALHMAGMQAALSILPLALVSQAATPVAADYQAWGQAIATACVLSILILSPLTALSTGLLEPLLLKGLSPGKERRLPEQLSDLEGDVAPNMVPASSKVQRTSANPFLRSAAEGSEASSSRGVSDGPQQPMGEAGHLPKGHGSTEWGASAQVPALEDDIYLQVTPCASDQLQRAMEARAHSNEENIEQRSLLTADSRSDQASGQAHEGAAVTEEDCGSASMPSFTSSAGVRQSWAATGNPFAMFALPNPFGLKVMGYKALDRLQSAMAPNMRGSGEVNTALLLPPWSASRDIVGTPTAETDAIKWDAALQEAGADAAHSWRNMHKDTLIDVAELPADPGLQQPAQHMQVGPDLPSEEQTEQAAQATVGALCLDSAVVAAECLGQGASLWRRMSQDSIPAAPGSAETLVVRATSSRTESEDLTYAVMDDYSLAGLPSQAQTIRQRSMERAAYASDHGEQQDAGPSYAFASTTNRESEEPGPPLHADVDTPASFTFSQHSRGAEWAAINPIIFGAGSSGGGVSTEAPYVLYIANSWPASPRSVADDTSAPISSQGESLAPLVGRGVNSDDPMDGRGQEFRQEKPVASLRSIVTASSTVQEFAIRGRALAATGADKPFVDGAGDGVFNPFLDRAAKSSEKGNMSLTAAMQEMRLSDNREAQHSEKQRRKLSSPSAALAALHAARSGVANLGSSSSQAMGRIALLPSSALGQLVKNMSKTSAKPNALHIVRHGSESPAQPATPKQASLLEGVMTSYGVAVRSQVEGVAKSPLRVAPYNFTSPRPTLTDLCWPPLSRKLEGNQKERSKGWAEDQQELVVMSTQFTSAAKRYSDVDPRQIRPTQGDVHITAHRRSSEESI